jgi:hypothetical protein
VLGLFLWRKALIERVKASSFRLVRLDETLDPVEKLQALGPRRCSLLDELAPVLLRTVNVWLQVTLIEET